MGKKTVALTATVLLVATVSAVTVDQEFLKLQDGEDLSFGSDNDFSLRYDSSSTQFELYDDRQDLNLLTLSDSSPIQLNTDLELNQANITDVGLVDGVNITDHSARHENGGSDEINVQDLPGVLSQPQKPKIHGNEKHTQDYTTTSTDIESFSTNASSDKIPVSDSNGNIEMKDVGQIGKKNVLKINESYTTDNEDTVLINEVVDKYNLSTFAKKEEYSDNLINDVEGIEISPEGQTIYVTEPGTDSVYYSNLSNPYDLTSVSQFKEISFSNGGGYQDIKFKSVSGDDHMYLLSNSDTKIYQYTVSADDYRTPSFSYTGNVYDYSSETSTGVGLSIVESGNSMFLAGNSSDVEEYGLGTAYDVSTSTHEQSVSLDVFDDSVVKDVGWSSSGNTMFTLIRVISCGGLGGDCSTYGSQVEVYYNDDEFNGPFDPSSSVILDDVYYGEDNGEVIKSMEFDGTGSNLYLNNNTRSSLERFVGQGVGTVTLSSQDNIDGNKITLKDTTGRVDSSNVLVNTVGDAEIDGRNSLALTSPGESWDLQSVNGNWYRVGGE